MISSFYLVYHLALGPKHGKLFEGYEGGHWWQYLIAVGIFFFGMIFCCGGKIESTVIDREKRFLELHKRNIICMNKKRVFDLTRVTNIRVVKKGHDGLNFYTVHFTIQAEFHQQAPIKILESKNREKIVQQALLIRNFLGMFTLESQLHIYDSSTRV